MDGVVGVEVCAPKAGAYTRIRTGVVKLYNLVPIARENAVFL